jgi:hypothetical protein
MTTMDIQEYLFAQPNLQLKPYYTHHPILQIPKSLKILMLTRGVVGIPAQAMRRRKRNKISKQIVQELR